MRPMPAADLGTGSGGGVSDEPREVLVIVPTGWKVHYTESDYIDQAYLMDVSKLERLMGPPLFSWSGLPVYDAEKRERP
jgi:hypothetical protein